MSKHNAYLRDENLLTLFSLNNLIVPETQREYVWGNNSEVLEKFLTELKMKAAPCETCHHVHTNKNINVGFLYSYKPSYVKYESERILDEYLIDGQQRITTLFLLLLYRATIENRFEDFIAICRVDENDFEMGFNYKVRSLTQQFIVHLIHHAHTEGSNTFDFISDLENTPYWFLDDYKSDPTVMSMINTLKSIKKIFGDPSNYYFDYLLTNIHFWHFKTEATSQGEELYITMNSRGEQLADNEMQKARALPSDELLRYGQKWEQWQTFFWRNRKAGEANNINADKGFNNFLACIEGFEGFFKRETPKVGTIEKYMQGLQHICSTDFEHKIRSTYSNLYSKWFDVFIKSLWNEINTYDGKWNITDPRGGDQKLRDDYKNKSIARNKSMLFWSWMMYFNKYGEKYDDELLIKILHFYYIRYNCFKRSSTSIETIIDCFVETNGKVHTSGSGLKDDEDEDNINSKTFSEEELLLSELYYSDESKVRQIESAIWEIQDLPYFIDGKGVGGNTIYEFFNDDKIIDKNCVLESAKSFKIRIKNLLSEDKDKSSHIDIKRILLFYKFDNKCYWLQQTPSYYYNYETSNWNRIVRSKHFIEFYKEFYDEETNLNDFLKRKRKEFFEENKVINRHGEQWSHRKLIILYDLLSVNGVWDSNHFNISLWNAQDTEKNEGIFIGQCTVWKAKRYYDSNAKIMLRQDWKKFLNEKYGVQIIE